MFLPCGNGWTANNSGPPADCDVLLDMTGSFFVPKTTSQSEFMEFFNSAVDTLQTIVIGLGGALCVWGGVNLLEGYGQDNPASKSQGVKQLVAGGGVALIGLTLVPLLSGLLG